MSTSSMHPGDRGALTPEERALADRLARLGPQGEPSPALDARILAAAREAATAPSPVASAHATRRRKQRRWPIALGTAATLAIVGGLAWQLRPVDEMYVEYSEAPRAVSGPSAAATPAPREARRAPATGAPAAASADPQLPQAEAGVAAEPAVAHVVQPSSPTPAEPAPTADEQAARETAPPKAFPAPAAAPAEPPVVFDEPSPMDTPSPRELRQLAPPPAPPPPAPPAPAAPAAAIAPQQATGSTTQTPRRAAGPAREAAAVRADEAAATQRAKVATGTSVQPARPASAAAAAEASALDRVEVTGSRIDAFDSAPAVDQPVDDQPPASADSPQVQQAWLKRVRELLAEGRPDAARESLREYQRRYPEAELPRDLRALLAE